MKRQEAIDPAEVNVDRERLSRAVELLRQGIAESVMPCAVVCAMRRGQIFLHQAMGTLGEERPAGVDTRFDLASLTKPIAGATTVLRLVEQGRLALATPLSEILGARAGSHGDVTIRHLLTHTSGLPAWSALYHRSGSLDAAADQILSLPFESAGTQYRYSCLGFILLARIVEIVSGSSFADQVSEAVLTPLCMKDTGFRPDEAHRGSIAPTISREQAAEGEEESVPLVGVVHDGNARALGGVSGNAGLFGTARDVATFGEAVRQGGLNRERLFGAPTVSRILTAQIDPAVGAHTLMFFAQGNPLCPSGDLLSDRCVGHSGYTGTVLTLDPQYDLTVALLTNRVVTDPDGARWLMLRRRFLNALAASLS